MWYDVIIVDRGGTHRHAAYLTTNQGQGFRAACRTPSFQARKKHGITSDGYP